MTQSPLEWWELLQLTTFVDLTKQFIADNPAHADNFKRTLERLQMEPTYWREVREQLREHIK